MCLPLEAARPCCQAGLRGLSAASLLPQPSRPPGSSGAQVWAAGPPSPQVSSSEIEDEKEISWVTLITTVPVGLASLNSLSSV